MRGKPENCKRRRISCTSVWYCKRQDFRIRPTLHKTYSFLLKEITAQTIDYLWNFSLCFRTPAKIMLLPQAQTSQYRFLRRSRRLYGNQKSCRSPGSLQNILRRAERSGDYMETRLKSSGVENGRLQYTFFFFFSKQRLVVIFEFVVYKMEIFSVVIIYDCRHYVTVIYYFIFIFHVCWFVCCLFA